MKLLLFLSLLSFPAPTPAPLSPAPEGLNPVARGKDGGKKKDRKEEEEEDARHARAQQPEGAKSALA